MNVSLSFSLASPLGWTLLHSLWQWTLIALVWAIIQRVLFPHAAIHRYWGGIVSLGIGFVASVGTFCILYEAPLEMPVQIRDTAGIAVKKQLPLAETSIATQSHIQWDQRLEQAFPWLLGAWFMGILLMSIRMLLGYTYLSKLRKRGIHPLPQEWHATIQRLTQRLQLTQQIHVYCSSLVGDPLTLGHFKPIVLLPVGILASLTPDQVEAILAHELAHIKRADFMLNLIQSVIEILFFYHPAVWWISREIRREREACCDDLAVQVCGDAYVYASALTQAQMLRSTFQPLLTMNAIGAKHAFTQRIQRLFSTMPEPTSVRKTIFAAFLVLGLASGLSFQLFSQSETESIHESSVQDRFTINSQTTIEEFYAIVRALADQGVRPPSLNATFGDDQTIEDFIFLTYGPSENPNQCTVTDLQEAELWYDPSGFGGLKGRVTGGGEINCISLQQASINVLPTTTEAELQAFIQQLPASPHLRWDIPERTAMGNLPWIGFIWGQPNSMASPLPAHLTVTFSDEKVLSVESIRLNQGPEISEIRDVRDAEEATWEENLAYAKRLLSTFHQDVFLQDMSVLETEDIPFLEGQLTYIDFLLSQIDPVHHEDPLYQEQSFVLNMFQDRLTARILDLSFGEISGGETKQFSITLLPTTSAEEFRAFLSQLPNFEEIMWTTPRRTQHEIFSFKVGWTADNITSIELPAYVTLTYSKEGFESVDIIRLDQGAGLEQRRTASELANASREEKLNYAQTLYDALQAERKDYGKIIQQEDLDYLLGKLDYIAFILQNIPTEERGSMEGNLLISRLELSGAAEELRTILDSSEKGKQEARVSSEEPGPTLEIRETNITILEEGENYSILKLPVNENGLLAEETSISFDQADASAQSLLFMAEGLQFSSFEDLKKQVDLRTVHQIDIWQEQAARDRFGTAIKYAYVFHCSDPRLKYPIGSFQLALAEHMDIEEIPMVIEFDMNNGILLPNGNRFKYIPPATTERPLFICDGKQYASYEAMERHIDLAHIKTVQIWRRGYAQEEFGSVGKWGVFEMHTLSPVAKTPPPNQRYSVPHPNPFSPNIDTETSFNLLVLQESRMVSITILTLDGRLVDTIVDQESLRIGDYEFHWQANDVSPGTYLIHFQVDEHSWSNKVVVRE